MCLYAIICIILGWKTCTQVAGNMSYHGGTRRQDNFDGVLDCGVGWGVDDLKDGIWGGFQNEGKLSKIGEEHWSTKVRLWWWCGAEWCER